MSYKFKAALTRSLQPGFRWLKILFITAVLGLQSCEPNSVNPNVIASLSLKNESTDSHLSQRPNEFCDSSDPDMHAQCTPDLLESLQFAEEGKSMLVWLEGKGTCVASVDFGDGTPPSITESFHIWPWPVLHTYTDTGWPGKKLIRVKGQSGCYGEVTKEITVGIGPNGLEEYTIGFAPSKTTACESGSGIPIIRKGSGVRISTNGGEIIYGTPRFNASGDMTGTTTPTFFAFPMFRVFSLVYKVGISQLIQGEVGPVVFKAAETAPIEICVNDNPGFLGDNAGGMKLTVTVNEISAE